MAGVISGETYAQPELPSSVLDENCTKCKQTDCSLFGTSPVVTLASNESTSKLGKQNSTLPNEFERSHVGRRHSSSLSEKLGTDNLSVDKWARQRSASSSSVDRSTATKKVLNLWRKRASSSVTLSPPPSTT